MRWKWITSFETTLLVSELVNDISPLHHVTPAGFYMLPVSSLHEPPSHLLLRDTNEMFVAALKKEMMENPTGM